MDEQVELTTALPKQPEYCCRLNQEAIMAVVRNRSGMDSGQIDMHLRTDKFDRMSVGCLQDALRTLDVLKRYCEERIGVLDPTKAMDYGIDVEFMKITTSKGVIDDLTRIEFKIFLALARAKMQVISRDKLINMVFGNTAISQRNIDTHICHLRNKIKAHGFLIKNKRSDGYFLMKSSV